MTWDPQRSYAQLLTPAAKSQKLLLRLRHHEILENEKTSRAQHAFAVWQQLLSKNIPSTLWPEFCDVMLYPASSYIALLLWPFHGLETLESALKTGVIDGFVLLDTQDKAPHLRLSGDHLVISHRMVERLGEQGWLVAARKPATWQQCLIASQEGLDVAAAADLLRCLSRVPECPWENQRVDPVVYRVFFRLFRSGGRHINLVKLESEEKKAAYWLAQQVSDIDVEGNYIKYGLRMKT